MEKLKRLQDGEDVAELLAEIDDEMPSEGEDEEEEDPEEYGLTEVQKKVGKTFFVWIEDELIKLTCCRLTGQKSCLMWTARRRSWQCRGRWS